VAAAAALVVAPPVAGKRLVRVFSPTERVAQSEVVVVGKVSAIEKETVMAAPVPGGEKVAHKVAVIKIEKGLLGAANVTHVKVGFVPPADRGEPPATGPGRPNRGFGPVNLTEGQEGAYFLSKHPSGEFYTINPLLRPLDPKEEGYKAQLEAVTKAAAVLADPAKALKAEKAADRFFAATVLIGKYRAYPVSGGAVETAKVPADESQLILKALAEGDWKANQTDPNAPNAPMAFGQLGLTPRDGFKFPQVKPGEDHAAKMKEAYTAWLAAAGKDYQINKLVPKKK
jgi:hypothetical protein